MPVFGRKSLADKVEIVFAKWNGVDVRPLLEANGIIKKLLSSTKKSKKQEAAIGDAIAVLKTKIMDFSQNLMASLDGMVVELLRQKSAEVTRLQGDLPEGFDDEKGSLGELNTGINQKIEKIQFLEAGGKISATQVSLAVTMAKAKSFDDIIGQYRGAEEKTSQLYFSVFDQLSLKMTDVLFGSLSGYDQDKLSEFCRMNPMSSELGVLEVETVLDQSKHTGVLSAVRQIEEWVEPRIRLLGQVEVWLPHDSPFFEDSIHGVSKAFSLETVKQVMLFLSQKYQDLTRLKQRLSLVGDSKNTSVRLQGLCDIEGGMDKYKATNAKYLETLESLERPLEEVDFSVIFAELSGQIREAKSVLVASWKTILDGEIQKIVRRLEGCNNPLKGSSGSFVTDFRDCKEALAYCNVQSLRVNVDGFKSRLEVIRTRWVVNPGFLKDVQGKYQEYLQTVGSACKTLRDTDARRTMFLQDDERLTGYFILYTQLKECLDFLGVDSADLGLPDQFDSLPSGMAQVYSDEATAAIVTEFDKLQKSKLASASPSGDGGATLFKPIKGSVEDGGGVIVAGDAKGDGQFRQRSSAMPSFKRGSPSPQSSRGFTPPPSYTPQADHEKKDVLEEHASVVRSPTVSSV